MESAMSYPFRIVSNLTRRLVDRKARRSRGSSGSEHSSASKRLVFETWERGLLLAAPTVALTPPPPIVAGTVSLAATASDDVGVAGVKALLDGHTRVAPESN